MLMMILRREWKRAGSYESLYHLDAQLQDFSLLKGVVGRDRVLNSWISCIIFFSLLLFLRFFLEAFFFAFRSDLSFLSPSAYMHSFL